MAKFYQHNCSKWASLFSLTFFSTHLGVFSTHEEHLLHTFATKQINQLLTTSKGIYKNGKIIVK